MLFLSICTRGAIGFLEQEPTSIDRLWAISGVCGSGSEEDGVERARQGGVVRHRGEIDELPCLSLFFLPLFFPFLSLLRQGRWLLSSGSLLVAESCSFCFGAVL
jgi:hypothetical protein